MKYGTTSSGSSESYPMNNLINMFEHDDNLKNKEVFLYSLIELTKVEFNNLCKKSPKKHSNLLYKAYQRTNSFKKIRRLAQKYELSIPHETNMNVMFDYFVDQIEYNYKSNNIQKDINFISRLVPSV
ncbi:hypothetical protein KJB62_10765 [Staphylococcus saprophyticus]|uniref:hypothetical protein n=1 Tax=Staphylococcus saprophyticus TaxID=29385 RepID=UPI001F3F8093|nr:hypothetical protein [Staphylococcus saprophyticus]MCE5131872.1 hypothetical protein [Staphylococcus saprophyticus]